MIPCPKCSCKVNADDGVRNPMLNETYKHGKCPNCGHEYYSVEFEVNANEHFMREWDHFKKKQEKHN